MNRWEAEIDARSQTRVTRGERRRSYGERERERSLLSFLFFYFIFDSFIRSVPFRFVWFGSYEMGSKERKRMERGLVEEVSRGLLA